MDSAVSSRVALVDLAFQFQLLIAQVGGLARRERRMSLRDQAAGRAAPNPILSITPAADTQQGHPEILLPLLIVAPDSSTRLRNTHAADDPRRSSSMVRLPTSVRTTFTADGRAASLEQREACNPRSLAEILLPVRIH